MQRLVSAGSSLLGLLLFAHLNGGGMVSVRYGLPRQFKVFLVFENDRYNIEYSTIVSGSESWI